jgi:hypothetical protein
MPDEEIKPHYIDPISHLATILGVTRSAGYDKHLDRAPGPGRTHQPGNLKQNRAALLFHVMEDDRWIGGDWVGVSGEKGMALTDKTLKVLNPNPDGTIDIGPILKTGTICYRQHRFRRARRAGVCSEVALINGLYHYLVETGDGSLRCKPNSPCVLYLLSERLPCPSCSILLADFLNVFPHCGLHIAYMFDIKDAGQGRDIYEFLDDVKNKASAYKIQIVSGSDKGHAAAHGQTQWRPPGGATTYSAYLAEQGIEVTSMNIVPVDPRPKARVQTSAVMPSRAAGQPSAHFTAMIGAATGPAPGVAAIATPLLLGLGLLGAAWGLASLLRAPGNRTAPHRSSKH